MADSQVKTANICNITSGTMLYANAGGSGTYIADNSISVHMASGNPASGIYAIPLSEASVVGDKYTISFIPICATNNTLLIELAGVQTRITFTSGERKSVTIQASANNRNIAFYGGDSVDKTIIIKDIQIEKGETATVYRPYSATGWQHSLRKLTTATEAVENPLYSDGTAITAYTIKGNTVQNGTPTPSNPVEVNGVGVRTINIYDGTTSTTNARLSTSGTGTYAVQGWSVSSYIPINPSTNYCTNLSTQSYYCLYNENKGFLVGGIISKADPSPRTYADAKFIRFDFPTDSLPEVQLSEGRRGQDFEPYGYKIPISNGQQTTNIYLGSTQTVRVIKKLVLTGDEEWNFTTLGTNHFFYTYISDSALIYTAIPSTHYTPSNESGWSRPDNSIRQTAFGTRAAINIRDEACATIPDFKAYLAQQYANGTAVTVWYVLATPETAAVNEPLMKIGDYADTLSNATSIPTTEGANSITVDTTVQPSEFTATWTGWHNANVKEWDGSQWNE